MSETLLVVNDNDSQSQHLAHTLKRQCNYNVLTAGSNEDALSIVMSAASPQPELVLVDMMHPEKEGLQLLHSLRMCKPHLPVIILVAYGDDKTVKQAMAMGASDFLVKPLWIEQLRLTISKLVTIQRMANYIAYLERRRSGYAAFSDIIGGSQAMKAVLSQARQAAATSAPVWIGGAPGTGKELLALAIHGASGRAGHPFIVIECRTLQEHRAEKVLFGNNGTDSAGMILGKLREAGEGTVLLKNLEALEGGLQQEVIRVIETGKILSQDSQAEASCRARFILAGRDHGESAMLPEQAYPTRYRKACALSITMPSLHQRKQDIPELANHFVRIYAASENKKIRKLTPEGAEYLTECIWPGNVRELMQVIWRAVQAATNEFIDTPDIRLVQQAQPVYPSLHYDVGMASPANPLLLDVKGRMKNLESIEKEVIQFALTYSGGCMTHAAKHLGIGRSTLYRRMHALKLNHYISRENQTTRPTMRISSSKHS